MKSKKTSHSIGLLLLGFMIVVEIARNRAREPQMQFWLGLALVIGVTLALIYYTNPNNITKRS
jgi:hypothetical protein